MTTLCAHPVITAPKSPAIPRVFAVPVDTGSDHHAPVLFGWRGVDLFLGAALRNADPSVAVGSI